MENESSLPELNNGLLANRCFPSSRVSYSTTPATVQCCWSSPVQIARSGGCRILGPVQLPALMPTSLLHYRGILFLFYFLITEFGKHRGRLWPVSRSGVSPPSTRCRIRESRGCPNNRLGGTVTLMGSAFITQKSLSTVRIR